MRTYKDTQCVYSGLISLFLRSVGLLDEKKKNKHVNFYISIRAVNTVEFIEYVYAHVNMLYFFFFFCFLIEK